MGGKVFFRINRAFIVIALSVLIAILLIYLQPKAEREIKENKGRLVEVLPAGVEDIHMIIEAYGTVKPREEVKLMAEVSGRVTHIDEAFKEGNFIKKGAVLINIDSRTYALEVKRQRILISQTDAELKHLKQNVVNLKASNQIAGSDTTIALADLKRIGKLIKKNVVSQATFDVAQQKYLASRKRLQELENQIALTGPLKEKLEAQRDMYGVLYKRAQIDLEKTEVISPFNGWVLEKKIEAGQYVNMGQSMGSIYPDGALDVEVHIPVEKLRWFPLISQKNELHQARIIFGDEGSYEWEGRIARVKAKMEEKTRTLPVVIEVDNLSNYSEQNQNAYDATGHIYLNNLRPGMFVKVKINGKIVANVFKLQRYLLHEDGVVYLIKKGRLVKKKVNVLATYETFVIIDKGLASGDLVITTPLSGAVDGMQLRVKS